MKKRWYDYLWIASSLYLLLGFVNILFAWLGMLCFLIPLLIAIFGGSKKYCNRYCGRGQLFDLLGNPCRLSRQKDMPRFLKSKWFRYGFLAFFMTMFLRMIIMTVLVALEVNSLREFVTLLWTFQLPWGFASRFPAAPWVSQFAFGFYSVMLTSTLLGLVTMICFRPRSWCVYCPMGTMTQIICRIKNKKHTEKADAGEEFAEIKKVEANEEYAKRDG